jgi:hypothetical protein
VSGLREGALTVKMTYAAFSCGMCGRTAHQPIGVVPPPLCNHGKAHIRGALMLPVAAPECEQPQLTVEEAKERPYVTTGEARALLGMLDDCGIESYEDAEVHNASLAYLKLRALASSPAEIGDKPE